MTCHSALACRIVRRSWRSLKLRISRETSPSNTSTTGKTPCPKSGNALALSADSVLPNDGNAAALLLCGNLFVFWKLTNGGKAAVFFDLDNQIWSFGVFGFSLGIQRERLAQGGQSAGRVAK